MRSRLDLDCFNDAPYGIRPTLRWRAAKVLETAASGRHEINGVNRYPGISLLRHLRQKYSINTPVIFLTVITKAETLEELKLLGVADIVRKPILPSELKERVERALHSYEHQS